MPGLLSQVDPDGLLEYSVVYTDRALNHMSQAFQRVMNEISATLKMVYAAEAVAIVPGSGTFAMEAVARQFATGQRCLILRNGWFSYRWTQIFDMGNIPAESIVLKASPVDQSGQPAFIPAPLEEVVRTIHDQKPDLVLAPHVETSSGMILPEAYLKGVADAVHASGGMFILDCIASGAVWVDMQKTGADVLITAPQKGWSGPPCAGLVMLGKEAIERMQTTSSTSFSCDLRKWRQIMEAYEKGGHAYHATMPTDALASFSKVMKETVESGLENLQKQQYELGSRVRNLLEERGFASVSAKGFQAPGVVVSYTNDPDIRSGKKFKDAGLQIAAGVPLQCDEPADFQTFRLGLFGLEKLRNIDRTVEKLKEALDSF